jgi:hypothetical protein
MSSAEIQRLRASLHLLQHFDAERIQPLLQHAGGHVAEREAGAGSANNPMSPHPKPTTFCSDTPFDRENPFALS